MMSVKYFFYIFLIVSLLSVVGYFLMFYGGHLSEVTNKNNVFLILGEILMWPWIMTSFFLERFFGMQEPLGFFALFFVQYSFYSVLVFGFCFFRKIKRRN